MLKIGSPALTKPFSATKTSSTLPEISALTWITLVFT